MDAMNNKFFDTVKQYKKVIIGAAAVIALFGAAEAAEEAAHNYFHVHGLVTSVNGQEVTVSTRWLNRSVDFTGSPFTAENLQPGQHVVIEKNLQGMVINVKPEGGPKHPPMMRAKRPLPPHLAAPPAPPAPPMVAPAAHQHPDLLARYTPSDITTLTANPADDYRVVLEGTIVSRLSDEDYLLRDAQGNEIILDADDDRPVPLNEQLRIYGKTDVKKDGMEIDVKFIEPVI